MLFFCYVSRGTLFICYFLLCLTWNVVYMLFLVMFHVEHCLYVVSCYVSHGTLFICCFLLCFTWNIVYMLFIVMFHVKHCLYVISYYVSWEILLIMKRNSELFLCSFIVVDFCFWNFCYNCYCAYFLFVF